MAARKKKSAAELRTIDAFTRKTNEEQLAEAEADEAHQKKGELSESNIDSGVLQWFQLDTGVKQDTQKVRIGSRNGMYLLQIYRLCDGAKEPSGHNVQHKSEVMLTGQGWRNLVEAVRLARLKDKEGSW